MSNRNQSYFSIETSEKVNGIYEIKAFKILNINNEGQCFLTKLAVGLF